MAGDARDKRSLVESRGMMLIDDFSRATGLDRQTADALVTDRKVEGLFHLDGRVVGVFDDVLPTKEELRSWGMKVRDDYDPERHRSHVGTDDDPDVFGGEARTSGPSANWTMSWGGADS